jgi:rhodanese-related sulfurtransferase
MGKPKQNESTPREPLVNKMTGQITAIIGLSLVLGLAFNASNPIGIRLSAHSKTSEAGAAATPSATTAQKSVVPNQNPSNNSAASLPPPLPLVAQPNVPSTPPALSSLNPANAAVQAQTNASSPTTWTEVKPLVAGNQIVLLDARPKPSFDAGHIPGAISFPESSSPEEFAIFRKQYGTNTQLVVYCASVSCSMSKRLADRLVQEFGYVSVRYMTGGYQEWQRSEGLAVVSSENTNAIAAAPQVSPPVVAIIPPAPPAILTNSPPAAVPSVTAAPITWVEAKPLVTSGQVVLIDARVKANYDAGHIPGAISLPESSTPEEISAFQSKYGPSLPVIVYCGSQSCSLSKRLADKLIQQHGYQSVRYMTGGYQEWQQAELSGRPPGP